MNSIEGGGTNREEFKILPEDGEALNEEIQVSDGQKIDESEEKTTRRNFLKFVGGVAATIIAPELIMGQESEKNKVQDEEKKDPRKEAEIKSLLFLYKEAEKVTDTKRKNGLLENIGSRMREGDITIDHLGIESLQDKKIRELKKSFAFQISQRSPELQRKGLDLLYQGIENAGLTWSDLQFESENNESIMRLLPMDEQINQAFWFTHFKGEITVRKFSKNIDGIIDQKKKELFLDLYYYNKNKFKVINSENEGVKKEEKDAYKNFKLFIVNLPLPGIALQGYKIDQGKDMKLYEYLNKLSAEEVRKEEVNK